MMYLDRRQRYLSRSLGVYVQADTGNPTGWRPQYKPLGEMPAAPDWKTVHALRDESRRRQQMLQHGLQRIRAFKAHRVDAHARGDRTAALAPRLSGLGGLDLAAQMVQGAQYVFHFSGSNSLISSLSTALRSQIAADTNFLNPVVSAESSGMRVSFIYNGRGSSVGDAGAEMQNVLKSSSVFSVGYLFSGAEGGPAPVAGIASTAGKTVFATSPDGTVIQWSDGSVTDTTTGVTVDSGGNVVSTGGTPPGAGNQQQQPFDWNKFFAGFGVGTGTALAIGALGLVLLLRN